MGYTRIVTISTDKLLETAEFRDGVGAQWPFLSDPGRKIQKNLDIAEYTDPGHDPMIPHTLVLGPTCGSSASTTATGTGGGRRWPTSPTTCGSCIRGSARTGTSPIRSFGRRGTRGERDPFFPYGRSQRSLLAS